MGIEAFDAVDVVINEKEAQMPQMPDELFRKGERLSHQTAHTISQGQVEAFDMVCLSLFFAAGLVLRGGNDLLLRIPEVAVAHQVFVIRGNLVPQRQATDLVSRAKVPRHDLAGAAAQRNPNPHHLPLVLHVAPSAQRAPASNSSTSSERAGNSVSSK